MFGGEDEFRSSLVAYYLALNVLEYADFIYQGHAADLKARSSDLRLTVPLTLFQEPEQIRERGFTRLKNQPAAVHQILRQYNLTYQAAKELWPAWMSACESWVRDTNPSHFFPHRTLPHWKLFDYIEPV